MIDPITAALRLWLAQGIGSRKIGHLLSEFGTIDALLNIPVADLPRKFHAIRRALEQKQPNEQALLESWTAQCHVTSVFADNYPERLRHLPDPPLFLFWLGSTPQDWQWPRIAIVGSRQADNYGLQTTRRFAHELVGAGASVGSGLAYGIDTAAHQGALDGQGQTWACLAHGLEQIYPRRNRGLAKQILDMGGSLLSEFPPGTEIRVHNFPARNRLIAALADAVVVAAGAQKSGALITADFALQLGRPVLAVPGRVGDHTAEAPLNLLKHGAIPAIDAESILDAVGLIQQSQPVHAERDRPTDWPTDLPDHFRQILNALPKNGNRHIDDLAKDIDVGVTTLLGDLLQLELAGWVEPMPGKYYTRSFPRS